MKCLVLPQSVHACPMPPCIIYIAHWIIYFVVSHTTDDLVFEWLPEEKVPLAVDSGIELPQLELVSNDTGDCTSVYSTGE